MYLLNIVILCIHIAGMFSQQNKFQEKIVTQFMGFVKYFLNSNEIVPIQDDVKFFLFTQKNKKTPHAISKFEDTIHSLYNPNVKTYFIIHGFTDHKDRDIIVDLRTKLVNAEDANIFVVDWKRRAGLIYFEAANSTMAIGLHVGKFLMYLNQIGLNLENVHLIGHSLGAHISGIAGAFTKGKVARITGLDPAGPLFEFITVRDGAQSLDSSDAKFVDIIHTNGEEFGTMKPGGHADFYPNHGVSPQPGCGGLFNVVSCSHIRSVLLYTESINASFPFEARHCKLGKDEQCPNEIPVHMGHMLSSEARGVYYLETGAEPPFAVKKERNFIHKEEL